MAGLTAYSRQAVLQALAGGPSFYLPATPDGLLWLALLAAAAPDDGIGANLPEVSYPGYSRTEIAYSGSWTLDSSKTLWSNAAQIALPTLTSGGPVTVLGWALCDGPTDGNVMWTGGVVPWEITLADPSPVTPPGYLILNLAAGT